MSSCQSPAAGSIAPDRGSETIPASSSPSRSRAAALSEFETMMLMAVGSGLLDKLKEPLPWQNPLVFEYDGKTIKPVDPPHIDAGCPTALAS
jgi:hypothetical protein